MKTNSFIKSVFIFGICFFLLTNLYAQWPQWRDPNRDGVCNEDHLLKSWPEGGPNLLWSVDSLGDSFSSTAIDGE